MARSDFTKNSAVFLEEPADRQVAWEIERENLRIDQVDPARLFYLSRKQLKAWGMSWAQEVVDDYWQVVHDHRDGKAQPKEYNHYGVRLIEQRWTFTIQWFLQKPTIKGRKPKIVMLKEPPKKSFVMSESKFPYAHEWELEAIMEAEKRFGEIRKLSRYLQDINVAYNIIRAIIDKNPREIPEL